MNNMTDSLTARGIATRQRILDAAVSQFAVHGYARTTMRDIADAANCSPGLTYRYFTQKEELALALFSDLTDQWADSLAELPDGTLADRFHSALLMRIDQLRPYRGAVGAVFSAAMREDEPIINLYGPEAEGLHQPALAGFEQLIAEASDRPRDPIAASLAQLMHTLHLMLLVFWLNDRSPQQETTRRLVGFVHEAMRMLRPMLILPLARDALEKFTAIISHLSTPTALQHQ